MFTLFYPDCVNFDALSDSDRERAHYAASAESAKTKLNYFGDDVTAYTISTKENQPWLPVYINETTPGAVNDISIARVGFSGKNAVSSTNESACHTLQLHDKEYGPANSMNFVTGCVSIDFTKNEAESLKPVILAKLQKLTEIIHDWAAYSDVRGVRGHRLAAVATVDNMQYKDEHSDVEIFVWEFVLSNAVVYNYRRATLGFPGTFEQAQSTYNSLIEKLVKADMPDELIKHVNLVFF